MEEVSGERENLEPAKDDDLNSQVVPALKVEDAEVPASKVEDAEVTGAEEAHGKVFKGGLNEVEEEEKGRGDNCDTFKRPSIPYLAPSSDTTRTTL